MPSIDQNFIAAVNGTTRDTGGWLVTSAPSGSRNLWGGIINEKFVTINDPAGYTFTEEAHAQLSAAGAEPYAGGTALKVGTTFYSVVLVAGGTQIDVAQTSP